jgi:purine-binding chemotaxis protein CheW
MNGMVEQSGRRNDRTKSLVGFMVGDIHYAVSIGRVREIINPLPIVELPHPPPTVIGVAHHRGEVLPVVDLRQRFGLPHTATTRKSRFIIVTARHRSIALIVDAVTDVFGPGADAARQVPSLGAGEEARGITASYIVGGQLVFVVDGDRVTDVVDRMDLPRALPEGAS